MNNVCKTKEPKRKGSRRTRSETLCNRVGEQDSETLPKQFIQTPLTFLKPNVKLLEKNI